MGPIEFTVVGSNVTDHQWHDCGPSPDYGSWERIWECEKCGTRVYSGDRPWVEKDCLSGGRLSITSITCGMGPALIDQLSDCDMEMIRLTLKG